MDRRATLYRYLTGPDDAAFCRRVTEALADGWMLYGSPSLTYDATLGRTVCGQAVIKEIEGPYRPDLPLSDQ